MPSDPHRVHDKPVPTTHNTSNIPSNSPPRDDGNLQQSKTNINLSHTLHCHLSSAVCLL